MFNKKTILLVAAVLCLLLAVTAITFSIQPKKQKTLIHHRQKMQSKSTQVQLKSSTPAPMSAANQLHEKRLQAVAAWQKYHQIQKQRQTKMQKDQLSQTKSALQKGASWLNLSLEKRIRKAEKGGNLFPHVGIMSFATGEFNQNPDLTIISSYPGDQATNVPLDTVISVTFSDSLDKYAALDIGLFPPAREVSDPVLSNGGKTVSATVALDSNTTYQLIVMEAVTPDSERIEPQIAATFSTGSTIPTGSIYGKITFPFDPTTHWAFAVAFPAEMTGDDDTPYRVSGISSIDSSYSIENLPSGNYLLLAVQDLDGDSEPDLFGFYDADGNGEPDPIFVPEGQAVGSLDFQLPILEVVASYPADGTLNVPTDTTISITFNLPVDYQNENFDLQVVPPPISQGFLSVSPDGRTIYLPVTLEDSTVYQILMMGAETPADPGQTQIGPYLAYFSTGTSFPSATISGTVTFADFTPTAAFAFLLPSGGEGEDDFTNVAEINLADGSYTIVNVPPGTYYPAFWASIPRNEEGVFTEYPDSIEVNEGDAITGIDITMSLGADIALYGHITGSKGVAGVEIEAYNTTKDQEFEGETNFLGYYRMMVSGGFYDIYFYPPWNSRYMEMDTTNINITTDTELNVSLNSGYYIFGMVTDTSGAPIPEVGIEVVDAATEDWVAGGGTNGQGEYRVTVPPGTYNVYFWPWQTRYIAKQVNNVVVNADYYLDITLQAGSLVDGTVTNEDSTPLERVGVIAFEVGTWNVVAGTSTDEDGYYAFGLLPGTYDIFFDPFWNYSDYLSYTASNITVPPDTTIDVVLQRGSSISGRVSDPEDNPVENAHVEAVDTLHNNWVAEDWTDEDGDYSLTVLPGTYHIQVWPPSDSLLPTTIRYISVPPDTVLDIQLRRPQLRSVTGILTDFNSIPMDSVRLDILNVMTHEWFGDTTATDITGTYNIQLMDGPYSIIFRTGKWYAQGFPDQVALPSIVEISSDTTIDFILHPGQTLTGTVTDTSGNPVENAHLEFLEPDYNRWISSASTDINGDYFALLVPASYFVHVAPPQFSDLFAQESDISFTGSETYDFTLETIPTHDVGNVVFSWAAGRYGLCWDNGGQGFQYPPGQPNNHLVHSYLLIAMNDFQISEEPHFQPVSVPPYLLTTPGIISDQDGYTLFNDGQQGPVGVTVTQYSYAYANAPDNDYVILRLVIANNDPFPKDIVIGMYFDWDVGDDFGDDVGNYDATHNLGYIYSSDTPNGVHVGTAVLSPSGVSSYRAYDSYSEGYLDWNDKYITLTEGFQQTSTGPGDIRYYIATGPFTLAPAGEDSVEVAFAILAGDSLADLQANTEAAQGKYNTIVSVDKDVLPGAVPKVFSLSQNYPNPFNPKTTIQFGLPKASHVRLAIYNLLGQTVTTLVDAKKAAGFYAIQWDGTDKNGSQVASGVYICRIEAERFVSSKKLLLLR